MENFHLLKIKFLSPTNRRDARIRITSERFRQSIVIAWDNSSNSMTEIASNHLQKMGFEIVGQSEGISENYLISKTFIGLL
jgi:hypothetical protein